MRHSTAAPAKLTLGGWGMLIALSLLWGGSFFFNGVAVKELPPLTIVVSRVALAALLLLAILRLVGQRMPRGAAVWLAFFGMGLLNNAIPFTLLVWGQTHIASGVASILNATTPLFTVIAAHFLTTDEKMTSWRIGGVVIGLCGVAVMIGGDALRNLGVHVDAQLACLAAAVSYALAAIFGRRFKRLGIAPMATATGQLIASSLILLPLMLIIEQPWGLEVPSAPTLASLVAIASLSTALAYILYFRLLEQAGATNVALVTFLVPASAILLGVTILGEVLELRHIAGMVLIGAGLLAIRGR